VNEYRAARELFHAAERERLQIITQEQRALNSAAQQRYLDAIIGEDRRST
jgi:hypothetical protein